MEQERELGPVEADALGLRLHGGGGFGDEVDVGEKMDADAVPGAGFGPCADVLQADIAGPDGGLLEVPQESRLGINEDVARRAVEDNRDAVGDLEQARIVGENRRDAHGLDEQRDVGRAAGANQDEAANAVVDDAEDVGRVALVGEEDASGGGGLAGGVRGFGAVYVMEQADGDVLDVVRLLGEEFGATGAEERREVQRDVAKRMGDVVPVVHRLLDAPDEELVLEDKDLRVEEELGGLGQTRADFLLVACELANGEVHALGERAGRARKGALAVAERLEHVARALAGGDEGPANRDDTVVDGGAVDRAAKPSLDGRRRLLLGDHVEGLGHLQGAGVARDVGANVVDLLLRERLGSRPQEDDHANALLAAQHGDGEFGARLVGIPAELLFKGNVPGLLLDVHGMQRNALRECRAGHAVADADARLSH